MGFGLGLGFSPHTELPCPLSALELCVSLRLNREALEGGTEVMVPQGTGHPSERAPRMAPKFFTGLLLWLLSTEALFEPPAPPSSETHRVALCLFVYVSPCACLHVMRVLVSV